MSKELEDILKDFDVKDWKKLESVFLKLRPLNEYSFESVMKGIIETKQKDFDVLQKRVEEFERLGNKLKEETTRHGVPTAGTFMQFEKLLEGNE